MANHVVKRAAYNRRWVGGDAGGIVPHEVCCIRTQNLGSTRYSNPACAVHADRRTRGYRKQHGMLAKAERAEPVPSEATRAPLEVRRSCLRRAQARRARLIRPACWSLPFIPHSEFRTPHSYAPLLCSQCGGTMKVIAVIERPAVIRQILDHLGLPTGAPQLRAPPNPPHDVAADQPREWSYEPLG